MLLFGFQYTIAENKSKLLFIRQAASLEAIIV